VHSTLCMEAGMLVQGCGYVPIVCLRRRPDRWKRKKKIEIEADGDGKVVDVSKIVVFMIWLITS
jgi:hypothetical protein